MRPWFARRAVGVGWRPATWQGWLVTATFVAALIAGVATIRVARSPVGVIPIAAGLGMYAVALRLTGPRRGDGPIAHAAEPAEPARLADSDTRRDAPTLRAVAVTPPTPTAVPRDAALVVDGLTKRFGDRVAFSDVSFVVGGGEVFGFLGPNGAGKTTTVRTLGTLVEPSAGSAVVAGIPLTRGNGQEIRQRIAIMPETPGLYLRLSVRENLEYFAGLFTIRNPRDRIDKALHAVNLATRADDLCGSLSKGLRQRVGLARALLSEPAVLFLDEPTSGLDPVATREVYDLVDGLRRRGVTIFLTTHRLDEAERLCDRVAILNTTLRMVGRPDELRARLFSRSVIVTLAAPLATPDDVLGSIDGVQQWNRDDAGRYVLAVTDPDAVAPAVTRALVAAGADVRSIGEARHSLEDVYLELISDDAEARAR